MRPLPIGVDTLLAVVFAWIGFLHGRMLFNDGVRLGSREGARKARTIASLGICFIAINLALLAVRSYPSVAWYLPAIVEYSSVGATWLADVLVMAFIFAAIVTVAVHERHLLRWVLLAGSVVVLACGEYAIRESPWATPPVLQPPRVSADGIVLQTGGSSCAAATCANIAWFYGIEKSEKDMVELLGTTESGTTPAQVIYGMQRLGLKCAKLCARDLDIRRVTPPAVLFTGVSIAPDSHAVAFMGYDGECVTIWDPRNGKSLQTETQLREVWQGRAIEVAR